MFGIRVLFAVAIVAVGPRFAVAEEMKIGYVDFERAFGETNEGKKIKADLKKLFETKQKELDEQQEELRKAVADLQKKQSLLPPATVGQKQAELQDRAQKVQQTMMRHQQEMNDKQTEATEKFFDRAGRVVAKLAAERNLAMVVSKSVVIYGKPELDMTNEVIKRYNAADGAAGGKK